MLVYVLRKNKKCKRKILLKDYHIESVNKYKSIMGVDIPNESIVVASRDMLLQVNRDYTKTEVVMNE